MTANVSNWVHQEGKGHVVDEAKAEIEKSFGLLTLELEIPYSRESLSFTDPATGKSGHPDPGIEG